MKDKIGYTLGDLGCCCTEQFRAMYLAIFYTLVLKVNPVHVGILMLITKLWDAINDPLIGALVDSHQNKGKGKLPNEEKSALEIWKAALDNITPQVEVKSRRVGGATFQVPTEIRPDRKESISMKNLIIFARKRGGKTMADKLSAEIVDAFNNQGGAFKRKEDMHRMAEANRAFAHFRF